MTHFFFLYCTAQSYDDQLFATLDSLRKEYDDKLYITKITELYLYNVFIPLEIPLEIPVEDDRGHEYYQDTTGLLTLTHTDAHSYRHSY